jgi:ABC-type amino acid transport substrate-binding protein
MSFRQYLLLVLACFAATAAHAERQDHLTRVLATASLRVCIWPDYYGITYRNPRTQELSGIDIDLAREFAKDLGGVAVHFVDSSFVTLIEDLGTDRCDLAMFGIGVTPARAEKLRFSRPYLQSDIYAVTTKANRRVRDWNDIDKPGVIVAVARGTYHEIVMREKLKQASLTVVDTPLAREREVESGRADVFMTDYPYSQRLLQNADWARLISPQDNYHLTPYAYAVATGDDRWQARVDRFVADIRHDGRLLLAAQRHKLGPIALTD